MNPVDKDSNNTRMGRPVRTTVSVRSRDERAFHCYLAGPKTTDPVPAVVLASTVHGVDADIRAIADEFAAHGFIAAAPDLFWRSVPGPLCRDDDRAAQRSQPRLAQIKAGESDMADTLAYLRTLPEFNGGALAMGFCYGGPYAIIGPKRLGYAAGVSCHGTQMLDYIEELEGIDRPIVVIWGDRDERAPVEILDGYRDLSLRMSNLELHIVPGLLHGFMMRGNSKAFNLPAYNFSIRRALTVLDCLRRKSNREAPVYDVRMASGEATSLKK